jgi:peptide subunit release factor RF-3
LDTPGHQDFSEDTYRTLTAVDSAGMVLNAAKGIEEQTRKLFEVCRLRDVSIITFVNKLDREARDPFDLLDEIEQSLALDVTPASWPIGMGRDLLGTRNLFADALLLFERGIHDRVTIRSAAAGSTTRNCCGYAKGSTRGSGWDSCQNAGFGRGRSTAGEARYLPDAAIKLSDVARFLVSPPPEFPTHRI